jgi:hypothetical protein
MKEQDGVGWFDLYPHRIWWVLLRISTIIATSFVLWGLYTDARFSSLNGLSMREIFWLVLMPVIIVIIYLSPMLWRNICPLASVNLWHFSLFGRRRIGQGKLTAHQDSAFIKKAHGFLRKKGLLISALLFWSLVPARLFLFNGSSLATFYMVAFVFIAAFVMGFLFPIKSGWCTSICPMAAVEKTYGMNPAFASNNARCHVYSAPQKRVVSCSGCSFNCSDVVNPEHAYWQANSNKAFHDTVNSSMRKIFLATLPAFLISFYLMSNVFIPMPSDVLWKRALFVYSFFALTMLCSYVLYWCIKKVLQAKAEKIDGALHIEKPSMTYALYKRRLDLSFVTIIMNIIWIASSYALVYKIVAKVFPLIAFDTLLLSWILLMLLFFALTIFSLWNGWNETPEPDHYKPSWW